MMSGSVCLSRNSSALEFIVANCPQYPWPIIFLCRDDKIKINYINYNGMHLLAVNASAPTSEDDQPYPTWMTEMARLEPAETFCGKFFSA